MGEAQRPMQSTERSNTRRNSLLSERGRETDFALRFRQLALPSITLPCRRTKRREATRHLTARLWRDEFSNHNFACFRSANRRQTL